MSEGTWYALIPVPLDSGEWVWLCWYTYKHVRAHGFSDTSRKRLIGPPAMYKYLPRMRDKEDGE